MQETIGDETIIDTLYDLANYSIMTIIEVEGENDICDDSEEGE